ncbi:MAG: HAD family hydrolase, partial [Candidatus Omnitrophica bacterium]|nr:HAD family hydrolase [Candidatus Omnitrophota bacterium]
MEMMKYSQIHKFLSNADMGHLPKVNLAVLRNVMIEPIDPYLRYFGYQSGLNVNVTFGEYDNIFQEAVGGQGDIVGDHVDVLMVFMKLESLSWTLSRNFTQLNSEQVTGEQERIQGYLLKILTSLRQKTNAAILFHGFEIPVNPAYGILDGQLPTGQTAVINGLNHYLRDTLAGLGNAYFVDTNVCLARIGADDFYDPRYWHIGRAPYTREALREIAGEDLKYIRALKGKNKKCLVLDCDNVLWGGIIGEDALKGIKLGKDHPGSTHYEFQQEVLNYYNRGIILALCSKNNEEDVWEVFEKHPDMVLKKDHIAAAQINWEDKAVNLKRVAQDLNIGLDSLVFVDDSLFEVNLVREVLPEVEVIHLDAGNSAAYRDIIASCGLFDTLTLSEEDKKRGSMYKAEAERKKLQEEITDMDSYYQSLEMAITFEPANEFSIPRIAQLTQKTNQFNLTTVRYSDEDIKRLSEEADSDVLSLQLKDKYGDSGLVGVAIIKYSKDTAVIDTLLLSYRVLGRGV